MEHWSVMHRVFTVETQIEREHKMPRSFSPPRITGRRILRLTSNQEAVLNDQFKRWPRAPYSADVILLAAETGLSEADVQDWYAMRLAQWRKEQGLGGRFGLTNY